MNVGVKTAKTKVMSKLPDGKTQTKQNTKLLKVLVEAKGLIKDDIPFKATLKMNLYGRFLTLQRLRVCKTCSNLNKANFCHKWFREA